MVHCVIALGNLEYRHYTNNSGNSGHLIQMSVVRLVEQQGKSQNTRGNCLQYQENMQVLNSLLNVNDKQPLFKELL